MSSILPPFLPQFCLILSSFLPLLKPQFNLCFVGNLEPRFGNHGLQTLGNSNILFEFLDRKGSREARFFAMLLFANFQKNPRAHKNKIGTPPPPPPKPPPKTRNFMDMGFPAERTHFFQVSIKLAQPFPAPELRTRILRTRGFF